MHMSPARCSKNSPVFVKRALSRRGGKEGPSLARACASCVYEPACGATRVHGSRTSTVLVSPSRALDSSVAPHTHELARSRAVLRAVAALELTARPVMSLVSHARPACTLQSRRGRVLVRAGTLVLSCARAHAVPHAHAAYHAMMQPASAVPVPVARRAPAVVSDAFRQCCACSRTRSRSSARRHSCWYVRSYITHCAGKATTVTQAGGTHNTFTPSAVTDCPPTPPSTHQQS